MISVEEARERILKEIVPLTHESVGLTEALGRVLYQPVASGSDHPPWNTSAMDGYAVRLDDTIGASEKHPVRLPVVAEIPAGTMPQKPLEMGEAARIMTGAPMPVGADAVVKIEETRRRDGEVDLFCPGDPQFVRKKGEAIEKGATLLVQGTLLRPPEIALLAAVGRFYVSVYRRPAVSILSTGDELVEIDQPRGPQHIFNSNGHGLAAQVRAAGGRPINLGITRDRPQELRDRLREALFADYLHISGGVSMGDYDFVRETLVELGAEMKFWKVAMKPGAPLAFGTLLGRPVFGLPGNPVSSMVTFEQFVRPVLLKALGRRDLFRPMVRATLAQEIEKPRGKRHFMRAVATLKNGRYEVRVLANQDSHVLLSLVQSNAFLIVPEECDRLKGGEEVWVQLLEGP